MNLKLSGIVIVVGLGIFVGFMLFRHYIPYGITITNVWADATNIYFTLSGNATVNWSASAKFYMQAWGLKADVVTVRCAKEGRVQWLLDLIGQGLSYSDTTYLSTGGYGGELGGDPWLWAQTYIQLKVGGGTISAIDINGVTTGLTSGVFHLDIGETISVTHTVNPTINQVRAE